MKKYVLDSFALLAYCEGETSGIEVKNILKHAAISDAEVFISVINWGEMYYIDLREGGKISAEKYRDTISKYPITIIDADQEITLSAAEYKANHKMSYADAFAAALAKSQNAHLVTGDKEFKQVEKDVKIHWLK